MAKQLADPFQDRHALTGHLRPNAIARQNSDCGLHNDVVLLELERYSP